MSESKKAPLKKVRSSNDFHSLAKSLLSFSDKATRAQSFSQSQPQRQKNCIMVNFRDCGLVSPDLRQGCVYRSSQVVSSEEVQALNLKAVLDLRVIKKPCKKEADLQEARVKRTTNSGNFATADSGSSVDSLSGSEEEDAVALVKSKSRRDISGCKMCAICTEEFSQHHRVSVPVYHSDLVPWMTKLRVFGKLPSTTKFRAITELCQLRNPEKMVAAAVVDPDVMGPNILYRLLLDHSKPAFAKAMRIFVEEANYPVLVHCIHGKDRTGLIIMLMLLLCDVPTKLVVADYIQSELQLKAGREKGDLHELDDFLKTDHVIASKAETMVETVSHLNANYGSAHGYCRAIGLEDEEIAQIRANFKVRHLDNPGDNLYVDRIERQRETTARSSESSITPPPTPDGGADLVGEAVEPRGEPLGEPKGDPMGGEDGSWESRARLEREAVPAKVGKHTPHQEGVLSDIALQAAGEAVEEELQRPSVQPKRSVLGGRVSSLLSSDSKHGR